MSGLTPEEKTAMHVAMASAPDGCWDYEACCWSAFEAMLPAVERIVAERERAAGARALREAAERWVDYEFVEVAWLRTEADRIEGGDQ